MIRTFFTLLVAGLFAGGNLLAGDHGIQIDAVSPWHDPSGYTPVVVTVDATRDIELNLQIQSGANGAQAIIRVVSGQPTRQTILLPPSGNTFGYHSPRVAWSGPGGIAGATHVSSQGDDLRCALIDPKEEVNEANLEDALSKIASKGSSRKDELIHRVQPVDLPDRWQGYPDWLVLVLTPNGNSALTETQRQAITTWTRSGGRLVVTTADLVREWNNRHAHVQLDALIGSPSILGKALNEQHSNENWRPTEAPVPGTESVPVKTFVFLALAFAIVVGPLNLWWVRRRNARHLFLITTPVLSFVTCVILIVASLLADGMSIKRDAVQVTYLDHRTQQAMRWTGCTYFAAFSRSQIELDPQVKVRLLDRENFPTSRRHSRDNNESLTLDWRTGQLLSGTVLPPRLNRQLSYTENLPERRRLVVSRSADGYQLLNGLGVDLLSVAWRDADENLWYASEIAAGESSNLVPYTDDEPQKLIKNPVVLRPGAGATLRAGSSLPNSVSGRIGREIAPLYERIIKQPLTFSAVLAAPMDALPGPSGEDSNPPQVAAFGHLPLSAATGSATIEAAP